MSVSTTQLLKDLTGFTLRLLVQLPRSISSPGGRSSGTLDVATGLTSCFLHFLLPPGWVLSHLESYKMRE
uniref:Cytochrome c oxidase subunit 8 n=1 Tax=Ursus americanus TaxID=9643 RepID=A0A452SM99_URSAM